MKTQIKRRHSNSLLALTIRQIKEDTYDNRGNTEIIYKKLNYPMTTKNHKKKNLEIITNFVPKNEKTQKYKDNSIKKQMKQTSRRKIINNNSINYSSTDNMFEIKKNNKNNMTTKYNTNNYYNENFLIDNDNINNLENEIESLKENNKIIKDKSTIFLQLMKQYSNKLSALINNNNNDISNCSNKNEIKSTLIRLNQILNNPKLKENFEITNILDITPISNNFKEDSVNISNNNITEVNNEKNNPIEDKDIENIINKYEEKINLLSNENKSLKENKNKQKVIHNNLINENMSLEKEISNLKQQIQINKTNIEDILSKINETSKNSQILQNKINILQSENSSLKKTKDDLSENFSKLIENSNTTSLKLELNKKNIIMKYLMDLVDKNDINRKIAYNRFKNKKEVEKSLMLDNLISFSKNSISIGDGSKIKETDLITEKINESNEKNEDLKENINFSGYNDSSNLRELKEKNIINTKKEIDDIDKEIMEIQNKIKNILKE